MNTARLLEDSSRASDSYFIDIQLFMKIGFSLNFQ